MVLELTACSQVEATFALGIGTCIDHDRIVHTSALQLSLTDPSNDVWKTMIVAASKKGAKTANGALITLYPRILENNDFEEALLRANGRVLAVRFFLKSWYHSRGDNCSTAKQFALHVHATIYSRGYTMLYRETRGFCRLVKISMRLRHIFVFGILKPCSICGWKWHCDRI